MPETPSPGGKRTLAVVLGVTALAAVVSCLSVTVVLKAVADDALGPPKWRDDAIGWTELPGLFGVRLSAPPPVLRSRVGGFQDPIYEVLFKLPPDGREAFLSTNGLKLADNLPVDVDEAKRELRAQQPGASLVTVHSLEGLENLGGEDGGAVELSRFGALLEADGDTWVYLEAWGT
jgi:hypothetical protein